MRIELKPENLPKEGEGKEYLLPNGKEVAIFCVGGRYFATDNLCPHEGGPLAEGNLEGDSVTCPWHGWQFDVVSGEGSNSYGLSLSTYRILTTDEGMFLEL